MRYSTLVADLQKYCQGPNSPRVMFIAGGALRDIDNGIAPKDIDIFVCGRDDRSHGNVMDFLTRFDRIGFDPYIEVNNGGGLEYLENMNGIETIYNVHYTPEHAFEDGREGIDIQVIFYSTVFVEANFEDTWRKSITKNFDLNICRIASYWDYGDKTRILKAPSYNLDKVQRVVSLNETVGQGQTAEQRNRTRARARQIADKLGFATRIMYEDVRLRAAQRQQDNAMRLAQQFAGIWHQGPIRAG